MSKTKHKIEVELKGDVLEYHFFLERIKIILYPDMEGTLKRCFERFEVEGRLDINLICRGAYAGSNCILAIKVDDKGPKIYNRRFLRSKNDAAAVIDSLELPLKNSADEEENEEEMNDE
jgi:hypothetical protein